MPHYQDHISSAANLVTPYAQVRAGFIALALEKNRKATPFVEEAKALKTLAAKAQLPSDLLQFTELRSVLLTAAGVSEKAAGHLTEEDKTSAIQGLIENFLEPAGQDFIDELVFRFLLRRGDSLGGKMRNIAGALAERKFSRTLIATLSIEGRPFSWLNAKSRQWLPGSRDDADIELQLRGLHWQNARGNRTLIYNLTVPIVGKNVDLCLFDASPEEVKLGRKQSSCHYQPTAYIALGELKGGIDPAGADEHWKTANSALERIRAAFAQEGLSPKTFFIGAAVEKSMAQEIYNQLLSGQLDNAANLTNETQLVSICRWLSEL